MLGGDSNGCPLCTSLSCYT